MKWNLIVQPRALKELSALPRTAVVRILAAIDGLHDDPYAGKKLRGEMRAFRVLRMWPYRIIYQLEKRTITVTVIAIGHRQGVYG